ncbi:MAG: RNA methyltransferase [Erysipelotrichaceae bacterium]|nr:RNA methyltransferase [Erysipelotrichaceae bacterium]
MNTYFNEEMKQLLGKEYEDFQNTQNKAMYKAIRINTQRTDLNELEQYFTMGKQSRFDKDTYLIDNDDKLGNHPFHLGGLFYIQEPSATTAVNALQIEEGDKVLDLCAAPGGKSTQILTRLNGTGFLVTNEISRSRANTLLSNIERWGNDNYLLTSMDSAEICTRFREYFDKILVDAPCSGASMFKKYPDTINDYNENSVKACALRQAMILDNAASALREGGYMVYSTCTYNQIENECVVYNFLKRHEDFELVDTGLGELRRGIPYLDLDVSKVTRIFPMDEGEGHFVARLHKKGQNKGYDYKHLSYSKDKLVDLFIKENCLNGFNYTIIKDSIYQTTGNMLDFKGLILRQGILVGNIVKNRIEPHQHFFTAINNENNFRNVYDITDDRELVSFLKGESLNVPGYKGYVQIKYHNHPIGYGKADNRIIKNKLPKGLRQN